VHRIEGTLKTQKMLFFDLDPYTLQISEIFHDGTRPHHHFDGLSPKSRRSVVSIKIENGQACMLGRHKRNKTRKAVRRAHAT